MKLIKTVVFVLTALFITQAFAQYKSTPRLSGVGLPFFRAGLFRTFSEDGTQRIVRIYLQMVNDDLTFVKEETDFTADVQFELFVTNKEKESVFNQTINKNITVDSFEKTNARNLTNTFTVDIPLQPNEYDVVINVLDKNSNKQVNRKIHFILKSIEDTDFLLSDILFFSKFETDSSGRIISFEPNLTNNFSGTGKYLYFYFASVVSDPADTLTVNYTIQGPEGGLTQQNRFSLVNEPAYNRHFIRINRKQFDQSRYELIVNGKYRNKIIKNRELFSFYWTVTPESPQDLDLALEQMRYMMDADSIGWALDQPYEEKLAYFKRFWKRMDPNPETEKNELMDEYYRRVNYANQRFSTMAQEGWETDRGRIYIKFGEPDDIERHPFEINSRPYEIWRYYAVRKVFLFVDRTGFGDYYLHPDYLDEEYN